MNTLDQEATVISIKRTKSGIERSKGITTRKSKENTHPIKINTSKEIEKESIQKKDQTERRVPHESSDSKLLSKWKSNSLHTVQSLNYMLTRPLLLLVQLSQNNWAELRYLESMHKVRTKTLHCLDSLLKYVSTLFFQKSQPPQQASPLYRWKFISPVHTALSLRNISKLITQNKIEVIVIPQKKCSILMAL